MCFITIGSGQSANGVYRQDGRVPDLSVAGVAQRRDHQLQVLGDERPRAQSQWRLCEGF